ncbi:2-oxo acid dehydrogenase subunit E2 [Aquabacterium sp.]|uniref:2-oxo acid dehydrogenase subunit E2 n=1 Tax=Aquabacterium sp. TaxID=1872578 RepID=UPI003783413C
MIELRLPSFGADMEDAEFVQWQVQPGQALRRAEVACVVETQKGAIDVEVWQDATVARLVAEPGQRLPVGALLAVLAEDGEDWQAVAAASAAAHLPPATPAAAPMPPATTAVVPPGTVAAAPRVSPAARRRATELGVDLQALAARIGTGRPLTLADIESAAASAATAERRDGMRAAIAAAMARSNREIPHYHLQRELVVEPALAWLETYNAAQPPASRVLFAALLLRAVALALVEVPGLNGRFVDGRVEPGAGVHIAMVTSLRGGGLVIPTLHDAQALPLPQLMAALNELLLRARAGRLRSSDLAEATVTVTNLGDLGADSVHGVIYPPQLALVGAGRIVPRAVVRDGAVVAARTVQLTLAADHRASDGATGARLLAALAERLDHPEAL